MMMIKIIKQKLKEKFKRINSRSQNEMEKAASNLEFEEAARIRDEIKNYNKKN